MSNKDIFIDFINKHIFNNEVEYSKEENFEVIKNYWNSFCVESTTDNKKDITENGSKILRYMQENYKKYNNIFNSKGIGEGLFMSSKSVSGSMKKLVTDEYVIKISKDPVTYSITEKGINKLL